MKLLRKGSAAGGKDGHVRHYEGKFPEVTERYVVGKWIDRYFQVLGQGDSWEQAFLAADQRENEPH